MDKDLGSIVDLVEIFEEESGNTDAVGLGIPVESGETLRAVDSVNPGCPTVD